MDVRWNSTYLMLKHLLPYKDTFSVFIHTIYRGGTLLITYPWYVVEHILQFLEQFYLSIVSLSGIYYPTTPLMMHVIIDIDDHLNKFENDRLLRDVIVPMKSKFLKYWLNILLLYSFAFVLDPRAKLTGFNNALQVISELLNYDYSTYYNEVRIELNIPLYWLNIPLLYSFAFVLDPRAKLTGFNNALQVISELLNHDYSTYYNEVRIELANLFAKYDSKFGSLRL
jgi:hypothetical protein